MITKYESIQFVKDFFEQIINVQYAQNKKITCTAIPCGTYFSQNSPSDELGVNCSFDVWVGKINAHSQDAQALPEASLAVGGGISLPYGSAVNFPSAYIVFQKPLATEQKCVDGYLPFVCGNVLNLTNGAITADFLGYRVRVVVSDFD